MDNLYQLSNNSSGDLRNSENGWQNAVIIIPVLLSASTLMVVVIIIWKSLRRKIKEERDNTNGPTVAELEGDWALNAAAVYENMPGIRDPVLEKWELPDGWSIQNRVVMCTGHYGPITRACLRRPGVTSERQDVVLRELSENFSQGEAQDFIDLMKFHVQVCNHDNLVKMLWCQTGASPLCLILKAMNPGNLLRFLWQARKGDLASKEPMYKITEKHIYSMASQVVNGLEYLTGIHNLVHGFVAACNILIHEDMSIQLCGLGLAAAMHRTGTLPSRRSAQVPLKWKSPEGLTEGINTEKSDVWSFGILLYEMVTLGAPPYPGLDPSQVLPKLEKMYRMEQPEQCGDKLYEIMRSCWQWDASERPCFTEMIKLLHSHLNQADEHMLLTASDTLSQSDYMRLAGISL
ncbi:tyrosine-protein kinase STYK1-like isoform X1 [Ascaphus truei]|uniref:tyrosine-protein kinase STYK1-like isoform X1 n=1 Tax=Ascaphus truei TaxID=8439 RepID=UPI003F5AB584